MTASTSSDAPGVARVYYAETHALAGDRSRMARWHAWLSDAERARFDRYRHDDDRVMFLCGRAMARELVGRALGVDPASWPWREGDHGRPAIALPGARLHFNLAHSAGLVVCAIADDREVGVDVEDRARRPVDPQVVRRYCAPAEVADIESRGAAGWHDRFLQYWTLKEAYLKARGLGISVPLADICFSVDGDDAGARVSFRGALADADCEWRFDLHTPTPRHLIAVAVPAGAGARFSRFE
jgi:4'-phosphopantetheinyl transferase